MDKTFEECAKDEVGTVYHDFEDGDFRVLIMRGPGTVNAYVGVKPYHPLYGVKYEELPSLDVHGGLTYSNHGGGSWPEGYWWFGWDYGHCNDKSFYYLDERVMALGLDRSGHGWTPDEIKAEIPAALASFRKVNKIAYTAYCYELDER
jgi:hypothetical protein